MSPPDPSPIKWTESAWEDLDGISEYLLGKGLALEAVEDFLRRIFKAPEDLAIFPGAGKPGRMPNTREWRIKDTPYILVYAVRGDRVSILRVMHDRRRFPE